MNEMPTCSDGILLLLFGVAQTVDGVSFCLILLFLLLFFFLSVCLQIFFMAWFSRMVAGRISLVGFLSIL